LDIRERFFTGRITRPPHSAMGKRMGKSKTHGLRQRWLIKTTREGVIIIEYTKQATQHNFFITAR